MNDDLEREEILEKSEEVIEISKAVEDNEPIDKEEEKQSIRSNLYDRIDVPVRTMDKLIFVLIVLIVFFIIMGIVQGAR